MTEGQLRAIMDQHLCAGSSTASEALKVILVELNRRSARAERLLYAMAKEYDALQKNAPKTMAAAVDIAMGFAEDE